jgi:large subunit ribosomal protein L6
MSRVGQKPIDIPPGVTVNVDGMTISAKGPHGESNLKFHDSLGVRMDGGKVIVSRNNDILESSSLQGLTRTLIANLLAGVAKGYQKELEIQGVGFKVSLQGQMLSFLLGFSAPVKYPIPQGIKISVDGTGTHLVVSGPDKQKVGDVAARIHSFFPAEPYKGKGIRFKGEYVRRKVGKTVA